ncbi:MAG: 5-(carboxyamino)imidazole ribonucleotide synthase, partial [Planctomycetes bacterium]|nr:5-(carboxyamino)imidazole ribonucleotide synthase [Planctomycetota bacterium]
MPNPSEPILPSPILPGAVLGILGSGQLGRMFAQAAAQLGYRVHVYSPYADSPAGQVADRQTVAEYDDIAALTEFAQSVDVVTLEFENVSTIATETVAQFVPVRPSGQVLYITQNRLREKRFLEGAGIACAPF